MRQDALQQVEIQRQTKQTQLDNLTSAVERNAK